MSAYLYVYLGAGALALAATPLVIRLAKVLNILDPPGVRKVHSRPTPRMGGVAIVLAFAGGAGLMLLDRSIRGGLEDNLQQFAVFLAGGAVMFAIGLIDDIRGLKPKIKLAAHLLCAGALCAAGVRIEDLALYDGTVLDLGWASWPVTMLWIVGIANAINFIDGLDGLAGGIAAMACAVVALASSWTGQVVVAALMMGLLGGISGFLIFNTRPAKIFLGDSGTYFIGFMLGGGSLLSAGQPVRLDALGVALLALGVPAMDLVFCVVRRVLQRRSIFAADRGHIHHQLLQCGLTHGQAVLVLYAVTTVAGLLAVWMACEGDMHSAVIFASGMLLLIVLFARVGAVRLRESLAIFRRSMQMNKQTRRDKRAFEDAQLRLREAKDFWAWWQAACQAALTLGFRSLAIQTVNRSGNNRTLDWRRSEDPQEPFTLMQMNVPIRDRRDGGVLWAKMELYVKDSLELAGRRAALFDRLMEELGPESLPKAGGKRSVSYIEDARSASARARLQRMWERRVKRPETEIT